MSRGFGSGHDNQHIQWLGHIRAHTLDKGQALRSNKRPATCLSAVVEKAVVGEAHHAWTV